MTKDHGIAHCLARLGDCPDLDALRRVWESLGETYKRHPSVQAFKDLKKEQLSQ